MKDINVEDRLIFALDVPEVGEAKDIVSELDESVNFYKIGMELLMTGKYFELLNWLVDNDKKVFVDLKFFDVPETVGRTILPFDFPVRPNSSFSLSMKGTK